MAVGEILIRPVDGDSPYQAAKEGDIIKNPGIVEGNIQVISDDYSIELGDQIILADGSSNTVTVTLPAPTWEGESYLIKASDVSNAVAVSPNDSEDIDGANSNVSLTSQWDFIRVVSDGTDWFITGTNF